MNMTKRILRDIKMVKEEKELFRAHIDDDTIPPTIYLVFIHDNENSLFYGQEHIIEFKLKYGTEEPAEYPMKPPLCTFKTPIWHANISLKGPICLDTLQNKWSLIYNIEFVFKTIKCLMDDPNPNSPLNSEAAHKPELASEYYTKNIHKISDQFKQMMMTYRP